MQETGTEGEKQEGMKSRGRQRQEEKRRLNDSAEGKQAHGGAG